MERSTYRFSNGYTLIGWNEGWGWVGELERTNGTVIVAFFNSSASFEALKARAKFYMEKNGFLTSMIH